MSNVMGYYSAPMPAAQPAAPAAPVVVNTNAYQQAAPGQVAVAGQDTWIPASSAEPYTAGIRTAGAAMSATYSASSAATQARWGAMVRNRARAGYSNQIQSISGAKSTAQRASYLNRQNVLKNQVKIAKPGPISALRGTFLSPVAWGKALGSSALVAVPMSLITNFMDWKNGRINAEQRNTLFVADAVGYTVTGAIATLAAGAVAATVLGGPIGTVVGIVGGLGLGWVYEKFIRPQWYQMVHSAMYQGTPVAPAPVPVTPVPNPNDQPK